MDGIKATQEIRKFNRELKIIAITANAYKQTKEACFEAGMNDFITKPVKTAEVSALIKKYLSSV